MTPFFQSWDGILVLAGIAIVAVTGMVVLLVQLFAKSAHESSQENAK
jgi:hypothetical protein